MTASNNGPVLAGPFSQKGHAADLAAITSRISAASQSRPIPIPHGIKSFMRGIRNLAGPQLGAPTNEFIQQFPLGQEPTIQIGKFARIRVTFAAAVNMLCYMKLAA